MKCDYSIQLKKINKNQNKYFLVTSLENKRPLFELGSNGMVHSIGFWSHLQNPIEIDDGKIIEVWIPHQNIDHIESLIYKVRK